MTARVAVLGLDRQGRQAVLALGDYGGTWTIRGGAFSNDTKIECKVTGSGIPSVVVLLDDVGIAMAGPLVDQDKLERWMATYTFPAGEMQFWYKPTHASDPTLERDALEAILEIKTS